MLDRSNNRFPKNLQAARRDAPVQCPVCDRTVQRKSRNQRFCSVRCRQQAHYEKLVAKGRFDPLLGQDTALPTNPPKKSNGINGLRAAKSGSNPRIYAPREVIARELIAGRYWREEISPDGVVVQVARIGVTS